MIFRRATINPPGTLLLYIPLSKIVIKIYDKHSTREQMNSVEELECEAHEQETTYFEVCT